MKVPSIGNNRDVSINYQDYYATLGVPKKATEAEIKSAFRKLARTYHPDLNPGDKAAEKKFRELNEAYEVLGNSDKRSKYDQLGPNFSQFKTASPPTGRPPFGPRSTGGTRTTYTTMGPEDYDFSSIFGSTPGATPGMNGQGFSDFFHSFFGKGSPAPPATAEKGGDVGIAATLTLEEVFRGTTRTVEVRDGTAVHRVEISLPAGVADGGKIRAKGQGGSGKGGAQRGDLVVTVSIAPHPIFRRVGNDVHLDIDVPLAIAITGGKVGVPTLKGTTAQTSVRPGTNGGSRLRLKGLGMPLLKGGVSGDLIAEVRIVLPNPIPPELLAWATSNASKA